METLTHVEVDYPVGWPEVAEIVEYCPNLRFFEKDESVESYMAHLTTRDADGRQRHDIMAAKKEVQPFTANIDSISEDGLVKVTFSKELEISDEVRNALIEIDDWERKVAEPVLKKTPFVHAKMINSDEEAFSDNLVSWRLTAIESTGMELRLKF